MAYSQGRACWWKKSCTSWYGKYPIIYRVLCLSGGCLGFRPSTGASCLVSGRCRIFIQQKTRGLNKFLQVAPRKPLLSNLIPWNLQQYPKMPGFFSVFGRLSSWGGEKKQLGMIWVSGIIPLLMLTAPFCSRGFGVGFGCINTEPHRVFGALGIEHHPKQGKDVTY